VLRSKALRRAVRHFRQHYPIASKMLVREELIKGAILTRFMVGLARVHINIPRNDKKVELTKAQKFQSFLERVFIEIVNIPVQVATMFFTQEFMARFLETSRFCAPPSTRELAALAKKYRGETHTAQELNAVARAIGEQFKNRRGLIAQKIYDEAKLRQRLQPVRNNVLQNLVNTANRGFSASRVSQLTDDALAKYFSRIRSASALALGSGMLTGAIISGYVLQTLNDKYYSTKVFWCIAQASGGRPRLQD
jgi:hypothetical protein